MIEKPRVGWIGEVLADDAQRFSTHPADFSIERFNACSIERAGELPGMNRGAPQNFVGHPVADAGKPFLHEQHRLDRRAGATFQKKLQVPYGKCG